jgi:enoyl-CoA hydratase
MSEETPVLTEVRGPILIITLNRPEAKNAANLALSKGVAVALDRPDADDALGVGIITGAGGTFCSGMDLKGFLKGERPLIPGRGFAGLTEAPPKKPLIAAVDGFALAGGMEIALACDMIVANRNAKFGIPEVKRGLAAAAGGLIRMPRQMPFRVAMEFALTGESFGAERAYELGIINRATDGAALDAALELAAAIGANGPLAVKAQAGDRRIPALAGRPDVEEAAGDRRSCLRVRGRPRGRGCLCRKARSELEGQVRHRLFR